MILKDSLHTLDIDTILDVLGHGVGAHFRDVLLERVPKELITTRVNDHGGIEIQGTVEKPIDGLRPTIRSGHWHEEVDPDEGGASDTYYIQVFRDSIGDGEKLELELFLGGNARSRFDFSGIEQFPNYEQWMGQLYFDLLAKV